MIKEETIKIVTEDARMTGQRKFVKDFGYGYDNFQFPFTASFYEHGEYIVKIEGKRAIIEKVN